MKTRTFQFLAATPLLLAALVSFNSFTNAPKDLTNGGGIAGGSHHFNYTAVENSSGNKGHFTWNGETYSIDCVYVNGSGGASIYLTNGMAVNVTDGKKSDMISAPFTPISVGCDAAAVAVDPTTYQVHQVTSGNLTVHK